MISQRFYFHKRHQLEGESVANYDAKLRKLESNCNFGDYLEEALHDRFACGLWHKAITQRLLSEVNHTYAKAMEIASAMEAADRDAKAFKSSESTVKKLHSQPKGKDTQPCIILATALLPANLRRWNVMHVVRKATLLQPADRRTRVLYGHQTH